MKKKDTRQFILKKRETSQSIPRIGLLEIIQQQVNPNKGNEVEVTLNVNGTVVSGMMIGMEHYYEEIGRIYIDNAKLKLGKEDAGRKILTNIFNEFKKPPSKAEIDKGFKFNLIFLRDVKIYTGNNFIKSKYWVGRIDSVDGFTLGSVR